MRAKCEACAHCKASDGRGLAEKEKKKVGKEKAERGRTPDAVHRVAFSEASAFTSTLCGADDKRIPPCFAEQVAEHLNFLDTRAAGKKKIALFRHQAVVCLTPVTSSPAPLRRRINGNI